MVLRLLEKVTFALIGVCLLAGLAQAQDDEKGERDQTETAVFRYQFNAHKLHIEQNLNKI